MESQATKLADQGDCSPLSVIELALQLDTFESFFHVLCLRMMRTSASPSRISVAVLPIGDEGVAGVHYVWWRDQPDGVTVRRHHAAFVQRFTPNNSALARVFARKEEIRRRLHLNEGVDEFETMATFQEEGATDYIVLPLLSLSGDGRALTVCTDKEGGWDEDALVLLRDLAKVMAVVLEAQEAKRLQNLALTDKLTRLANRHAFEHVMRSAWALCARTHQPMTVLFTDIDYFKPYNDHYGHLEGDKCLQRVAEVIGRFARRESDLAARTGGEEFVLMMPGCPQRAGERIAEELRAAVEGLHIPHATRPGKPWVTISIGVATTVPVASDDPQALVRAADSALYSAKSGGRNRFISTKMPQIPPKTP